MFKKSFVELVKVVFVSFLFSQSLLAGWGPELCEDVTCSNHGYCDEDGDDEWCVCDFGYVAQDLECIHVCTGVTCSGFGTCDVNASGQAECNCNQGYVADGLTCYNPCDGITCSGYGTCTFGIDNQPFCQCDEGYYVEGTECIPNPVPSDNPYCLNEEGGVLKGGVQNLGDCHPFFNRSDHSYDLGEAVYTLTGKGNVIALGFANRVDIYNMTDPNSPQLLHTENVYGPASDMLITGDKLIIALENGIASIDLQTFSYTHTYTYGTTKALRLHNGKIYVGDGQGIKVINPANMSILQQLNTSGDVEKLEIFNGVIYTFEWAGLKRFNLETLSPITTSSYNPYSVELRAYGNSLYCAEADSVKKLTFDGSTVIQTDVSGDKVELRNNHTIGNYTYFPDGNYVRVSFISFPVFTNTELEQAIRNYLGIGDAAITWQHLNGITTLDISNSNISSLQNIELLSNLENLNVSGNQISELSPLQSLTNLQTLNVSNNPIYKPGTYAFLPYGSLTSITFSDYFGDTVTIENPTNELILHALGYDNGELTPFKDDGTLIVYYPFAQNSIEATNETFTDSDGAVYQGVFYHIPNHYDVPSSQDWGDPDCDPINLPSSDLREICIRRKNIERFKDGLFYGGEIIQGPFLGEYAFSSASATAGFTPMEIVDYKQSITETTYKYKINLLNPKDDEIYISKIDSSEVVDLDNTDSFTISFWGRAGGIDSWIALSKRSTIEGTSTVTDEIGLGIMQNQNISFSLYGDGDQVSETYSIPVPSEHPLPVSINDNWHHYAVVFERSEAGTEWVSEAKLFVDGTLLNDGSSFAILNGGNLFDSDEFNQLELQIGLSAIDEFVLYNRALEADEVLDHYYGIHCEPHYDRHITTDSVAGTTTRECIAATKDFACENLPDNAVWYNGQIEYSYEQIWTGDGWSPADSSASYSESPDENTCQFKCEDGFHYENEACISNTRTFDCQAKPENGTVWNDGGKSGTYTQTWNGSSWIPVISTEYSENAGDCIYKCASDYVRVGDVCTLCGNGTIDPGETCDDGSDNGEYDSCKIDCSGIGEHCGDGTVNGPEICDLGSENGTEGACSAICNCNTGYEPGTNECVDINECEETEFNGLLNEWVNVHCNQPHEECVNEPAGSYQCVCSEGYIRVQESDGVYTINNPLFTLDDFVDLNPDNTINHNRGIEIVKRLCEFNEGYNLRPFFSGIIQQFFEPFDEIDGPTEEMIRDYIVMYCEQIAGKRGYEEEMAGIRFTINVLNHALDLNGGATDDEIKKNNRVYIENNINEGLTEALLQPRNFDLNWKTGTVESGICLNKIETFCDKDGRLYNPNLGSNDFSIEALQFKTMIAYPDASNSSWIVPLCDYRCVNGFNPKSSDYLPEKEWDFECVDKNVVKFEDEALYNCLKPQDSQFSGLSDCWALLQDSKYLEAYNCWLSVSNPERIPVYKQQLEGLEQVDCVDQGIKNIRGIEYATGAREIYLAGNEITDLAPFEELGGPVKEDVSKRIKICNANNVKVDIYDLKVPKNEDGSIVDYYSFVPSGYSYVELTLRSHYSNSNVNEYEPGALEEEILPNVFYEPFNKIIPQSYPYYYNCDSENGLPVGDATLVEIFEDGSSEPTRTEVYCHVKTESGYTVPDIKVKKMVSHFELNAMTCERGTVLDIFTPDLGNFRHDFFNSDISIKDIKNPDGSIEKRATAEVEIIPDKDLSIRNEQCDCSSLTGDDWVACGEQCQALEIEYLDQLETVNYLCGQDKYALVISYSGTDSDEIYDINIDDEGEYDKTRVLCLDDATGEVPYAWITRQFDPELGVNTIEISPGYISPVNLDTLDISANSRDGESNCPAILDFSPLSNLTSLEYLDMSDNELRVYVGENICSDQLDRTDFSFLAPLKNMLWLDISNTGIKNYFENDEVYESSDVDGDLIEEYNCVSCNAPELDKVTRRLGTRSLGNMERLKTLKMADNNLTYLNPRLSTELVTCECEETVFLENIEMTNQIVGEFPGMAISLFNKTFERPESILEEVDNSVSSYFEFNIPQKFMSYHVQITITVDESLSYFYEYSTDGLGQDDPRVRKFNPGTLKELLGGDLNYNSSILKFLPLDDSEITFESKVPIGINDKKYVISTTSDKSLSIDCIITGLNAADDGEVVGTASFYTQFGSAPICDSIEYVENGETKNRCTCDTLTGKCSGDKTHDPSLFDKLQNLQFLDISGNPVESRSIKQIENGSLVDVTLRKLDGVDKLGNLQGLYARNNGLKVDSVFEINEIGGLENLTVLDLSNMPDSVCDSADSNCNNIMYISSLESENYVSPIKNLKKLRELNVARNIISSQEDFSVLEAMSDLNYLDVSGNNISDYEFIFRLTGLEYLNASDNDISIDNLTEMPVRNNLENLRHLNLSNNQIQQLFWIVKTPYLRELYIADNKIDHIRWVSELEYLEKIDVSGNCLAQDESSYVEYLPSFVFDSQKDLGQLPCSDLSDEVVCGDGIIQRADCTGYENCTVVAGANEVCDRSFLFCDTEDPSRGVKWCNSSCSGYDSETCYAPDEDVPDIDNEVSDDDTVPCRNGEVVSGICVCNYGYIKSGGVCIRNNAFIGRGDSAVSIAGSSGISEGPGWEEQNPPSGEDVEYIHGCPVPTVENCFSEEYTRDKCGILHKETCNDIQRICLWRGDSCCIPESTDESSNCDPKYSGYCTVEDGVCTRQSESPESETFFGCFIESGVCKSMAPDCNEIVRDPNETCKSDSDCGCDDEDQCDYKCRSKVLDGERKKLCVAIRCNGEQSGGVTDYCETWDITEGKTICAPKYLKEYFEPSEDPVSEDLIDTRYEDGSFHEERRLPEPAFVGRSSYSSYLTWAQKRQAAIHNIIRPVEYKFPDLMDPARDPRKKGTNCTGLDLCLPGSDNGTFDNALSRDNSGDPEWENDQIVLGETAMYGIGCRVYGCPEEIGSVFNNTSTILKTVPVYGNQVTIAEAKDIMKNATLSGSINVFGRDNMTFDSKIDSCEEYVYQKYYDYSRFVDIATVYEREPFRIVAETVALESFSGGCSSGVNYTKFGNTDWTSEIDLCNSSNSSEKYSENIFWEVVAGISGNTDEGKETHRENGLTFSGSTGIDFSNSTVISAADGKVYDFTIAAGGVDKSFDSYVPLKDLIGTDPDQVKILDSKYTFVNGLKEQLLYLLLSRANIETLWNEKRAEAVKTRPEEAEFFKVQPIKETTRDILKKLSIYSDVRWIKDVSDVTDPALVAKYDNEELTAASLVLEAKTKKLEELRQKLDFDIRTTKFDLTDNAKNLWSDAHYGNFRYMLDEFSNDMRETREQLYPNEETAYLVEDTLAEIDRRIGELLSMVNGGEIKVFDKDGNYYTADPVNCFCSIDGSQPCSQGDIDFTVCNLDPYVFIGEMRNIIAPKVLEENYKKCEAVTNNSDEMFKDTYSEDSGPVYSILGHHKPLKVPTMDWETIVDHLNCDPDDVNVEDGCEGAVASLASMIKDLKDNPTYEHFHFGQNMFDVIYYKPPVNDSIAAWGYGYTNEAGEFNFEENYDYSVDGSIVYSDYQECYCSGGSCGNDDIEGSGKYVNILYPLTTSKTKWQCFEAYLDAMPLYQAELMVVSQRINAIKKGYELKKAQIAARKLKTAGMFDPKGAGQNEIERQTGESEESEESSGSKQPFNIPTSMEKWFSDYRQFGVDDLNANFSYIAGFGVKDFILDYNRFNPLPYLKDVDAFIPHIARAVYKNNFPEVYDAAMKDPEKKAKLELDIQKIAIWMENNLDNLKTIKDSFKQVVGMMKKFEINKFAQLAKGAIPVFDPEKIVDAIAKEAARELMMYIASQNSGLSDADPGKLEETLKKLADKKSEILKDTTVMTVDQLEDYKNQKRVMTEAIERYAKDIEFNVGLVRTMIADKKDKVEDIKSTIEGVISGDIAGVIEEKISASLEGIVLGSIMVGSKEVEDVVSCIYGDDVPPECLTSESSYDEQLCREYISAAIVESGDKPSLVSCLAPIDSPENAKNLLTEYVLNFETILMNALHQSAYDYIMTNLGIPEESASIINGVLAKIRNTNHTYNGVSMSFQKAIEIELGKDEPDLGFVSDCFDEAFAGEGYEKIRSAKTQIIALVSDFYKAKHVLVKNIKTLLKFTSGDASPEYPDKTYVQLLRGFIKNVSLKLEQNTFPDIDLIPLSKENLKDAIRVRVLKFIENEGQNIVNALLSSGGDLGTVLEGVTKFTSDKSSTFGALTIPDFSAIISAVNKYKTEIGSVSSVEGSSGLSFEEFNYIREEIIGTDGIVENFNFINDLVSTPNGNFISNLEDVVEIVSGAPFTVSSIGKTNVQYPEFRFNNLRAGLQDSLEAVLPVGKAFADELNPAESIKDILDFSAINELRIPVINTDISTATFEEIEENMETINPFANFNVDLTEFKVSPDFISRVIQRLLKDSMSFDKLKQMFSAATSGNPIEILSTMSGTPGTEFKDLGLYLQVEYPNIDEFKKLLTGSESGQTSPGFSLIDIMADALILRAEEIVVRELFKLPYAEISAHARSGLVLFSLDIDLFEATFYITSRLKRDEFGRIVDMEKVNKKAREVFLKRYDKKIKKLEPYQKYFFVGAITSLDDLKDAAISMGKEMAQEAIDEAQRRINEKLNSINDEKEFDKETKDPDLTDYKLAEIEEGGTVNFQIGPVPAYVNFGFALQCGIRAGFDMSYGLTQGFTIGASAGPYLVVGAYLDAGVGFDYAWVALQIGVGGQIDVFDFYAPFKAQALLKPEVNSDGIQVNFYLRSTLTPVLSLLSGKIYLKAAGRVGKCPFCLGFKFKKTVFEFDPLIKLEFGNIIPLKPLKFNLLTIGEGVKLMGKEL